MFRKALFVLLITALILILILNVEAQKKIIPGQVTASANWPNPCCYAHFGSFGLTITICNGMSETIAGNATLTVSKSDYQKSVVHGPFSCDSGCFDLNVYWQVPITAPTGTYNVMISIRPTASPYFDPIVIQKDRAFFVTPTGG
jgi:hypothetical protein